LSKNQPISQNQFKVELWTHSEFALNNAFWHRWGHEASLPFRVMNIVDLQRMFAASGIESWIFGGTLRDSVEGVLKEDHDDDLMVNMRDILALEEYAQKKLSAEGFTVVRVSKTIVSVYRYGRYVDLHPSDQSDSETLETMVHGEIIKVHRNSSAILREKYGTSSDKAGNSRKLRQYSWGVIRPMKRMVKFLSNPARFFTVRYWVGSMRFARSLVQSRSVKTGSLIEELSLEAFLSLEIDEPGGVNWSWRGSHMKFLYNEGETLGNALARIKESGGLNLGKLVETNLESCVPEPANLSYEFWRTGNNFFAYPFLFGFRHLVIPYQAANLYIAYVGKPQLYTREYFENLKPMSENEIRTFLKSNPIELTGTSVTSGRHRVSAMLGRLFRGEDYLPVYAVRAPRS